MNYNYYIFFLLLFIVLYLIARPSQKLEPFQGETVVCLMCVCPNDIVLSFAKKISKSYSVYIVCDDIYCTTAEESYATFIKISDEEVTQANYTKSNVAINKVPSAWDKALYYFCVKDTSSSYVWFIEEDVFVPRVSILTEMDNKYPDADLITKQNVTRADDPAFDWWFDAEGYLEEPYYRSLVCASRLSRALLKKISEFVREHRRLIFIEIMFNTLVAKNKMNLAMPEELSAIIWRHNWNENIVDENHLYHPVKDLNQQKKYRTKLSQQPYSKVEAFRGQN
jgi:hypothetical protein